MPRGYPELEFKTTLYNRGELPVKPLKNEDNVTLTLPQETGVMPDHVPRPEWASDPQALARIVRARVKGYILLGQPYKPKAGEWPVLGVDSDFVFQETW